MNVASQIPCSIAHLHTMRHRLSTPPCSYPTTYILPLLEHNCWRRSQLPVVVWCDTLNSTTLFGVLRQLSMYRLGQSWPIKKSAAYPGELIKDREYVWYWQRRFCAIWYRRSCSDPFHHPALHVPQRGVNKARCRSQLCKGLMEDL